MSYNVEQLLRALGIEAEREGKRWVAPCPHPQHIHPPGKRSTPSWSILGNDSEDPGSHYCFGCGLMRGGPWELVAAVKDFTISEAVAWLKAYRTGEADGEVVVPRVRVLPPRRHSPREMSLPPHVFIPSVDGSEWYAPALEYLQVERRLPDWQIQRWHMGYALRGRCAGRIVIPVHTRGRLMSYVARAFAGGGRRETQRYDVARETDPGARPHDAIFGEPGWDEDCDIGTVAEGGFSMLGLERAGFPNPCAILGAANLGPYKLDLLSRFRLLLVGTDPDEAGHLAYTKIRDSLCRWTEVRRIPLRSKPDDANTEELEEAHHLVMRRRRVWPIAAQP